MSDTEHPQPNPGSDAAVAAGCTCPIGDNARGEGIPVGGERMYWFQAGCPLHDNVRELARERAINSSDAL